MPSTFSRNTERQGRITARNWNAPRRRARGGVSSKIPEGPESAKREGRSQVIAIHLAPGMYLGPKLRVEEGNAPPLSAAKLFTQAKGQS